MIGQTLGHYRVVEQIGAGGMGLVFRAHDERLDRDVALKVLPSGTLTDENARKRFRKEALTLSKLNHPNIETVFDFDTQDGVDFLVMELIPGTTLDQKLVAGALPEKEVLRLGQQLVEGLAAAHEQSVIHRDLKPGNLSITPDGRLKILDFGLAKLLQPASDVAVTESVSETRGAVGTLPYIAPEQLRGEKADARSDIWGAGAVLYEMATGRRPFDARIPTALAGDIQHEPPPFPRQLKPELSSRVEELILKCLEKDPADRYQSAKEVSVDLHRFAAGAASSWTAARPPTKKILKGAWVVAPAVVLALMAVAILNNSGGLRDRLLGRGAARQIQSIAVLPLSNLSGDPGQEYFVDGMTEAVIGDLAQIRALKVISRTSVMHYKGTGTTVPEIARELGVDAVVEGSVVRSANQVRVNAQLIDARTDQHLWAQSYERELQDVLVLQNEVARNIADEIRIQVTPREQARLAGAKPVNPEATDAYLKGRYYLNRRDADSLRKALGYFQEAINHDPRFSLAYAWLSDTYFVLGSWQLIPGREAQQEGEAAALAALQIDPALADAHVALASARTWGRDWKGAEEEYRRAIELSPSHADARGQLAYLLSVFGHHEEAIRETRQAQALDPYPLNIRLGQRLLYARRYDEAIAEVRKTLAVDPSFMPPHAVLGWAYLGKGKHREAIGEFEKAYSLSGNTEQLAHLAHAYAVAGNAGKAREILKQLQQSSRTRFVSPFDLALVHIGLGEKEQALQMLERAYDNQDWGMRILKVFPALDPLRSDPRFQDLLRRMNFPQ